MCPETTDHATQTEGEQPEAATPTMEEDAHGEILSPISDEEVRQCTQWLVGDGEGEAVHHDADVDTGDIEGRAWPRPATPYPQPEELLWADLEDLIFSEEMES